MKITIEQIQADEAFMEFWNSVYGDSFNETKPMIKQTFMEIAYFGFIAGMQHQRLEMQKMLKSEMRIKTGAF
jgi:hypothetical protein